VSRPTATATIKAYDRSAIIGDHKAA